MGAKYRDLVQQKSRAVRGPRAVLNVLANYANNEGLAFPGYDVIAHDAGLSKRSVIRHIKALEALGEIRVGKSQTGPSLQRWIWITLEETPDNMAGEQVTDGHVNGCQSVSEQVTDCPETGDSLTQSGDKLTNDTLYRNLNEPRAEPGGNRARETSPAIRSRNGAAKAVRIQSPHFDASDFHNGFIPPGSGKNPVQVYYERFDITHDKARLTAVQEDDLVQHCSDLETLREVVTAYSRTNYRPGNLRLILDWYREGVPQPKQNGNGYAKPSKADERAAIFSNFREKLKRDGIEQ